MKGPPRKPLSELHKRAVYLPCTEAEADALRALSRTHGKPVTELIRAAVHDSYPSEFPPALKVRT
jgi:hypothetical protein